jgi:hypothetical protein
MIEAYKIAVTLVLDSNGARQLTNMAKQFETLDRLVLTAKGSMDGLGASAAVFVEQGIAAARVWRQVADAMKDAAASGARMPRGGVGGAAGAPMSAPGAGYVPPFTLIGNPYTPGTPGVPVGQSYAGALVPSPGPRSVAGMAAYNATYPGGLALNPSGIPIAAPHPYGAKPSAPGVGGVGKMVLAYAAYESAKKVFDAGLSEQSAQSGLMMQGFTKEEATNAYAEALKTQRSLKGSGTLENLKLIAKLMAVTQDKSAAVALMPAFAQLGLVLDAGGKHGGDELFSAIRAGEFRGVLTKEGENGEQQIDGARLLRFINGLANASVITGGKVGPTNLLQALRASGAAGRMIDDKSLFADMLSMILSLGPSQAGTALQGFATQFSGGKMSEGAANLLAEMHLIQDPATKLPFASKGDLKKYKVGMGQFLFPPGYMAPGAAEMASEKPVEFINAIVKPKIIEYLHANMGADYDLPNADPETRNRRQMSMQIQMIMAVMSRLTGAKFGAEADANWGLVTRDREAIIAAGNRDLPGIQLANDPNIRVKAFTESLTSLLMVMGDAAMPLVLSNMDHLANAMNTLSMMAGPKPFWSFPPTSKDFWFGDQQKGPIEVHVVNPGDLAHATDARIRSQLSRPPSGMPLGDVRTTPSWSANP